MKLFSEKRSDITNTTQFIQEVRKKANFPMNWIGIYRETGDIFYS